MSKSVKPINMRIRPFRREVCLVALFLLAGGFAGQIYGQVSVLTWHNDNARTGQNLQETILTPANVNSTTFGKLFTVTVDGLVDAQPLYVPSVTVPGHGVRNVLYVVTENDSAYAFDADNGAQYWHSSLVGTNETPSDDLGCSQVTPTIGATATPAIDLSKGPHGTLYTVGMTKDGSGNYHHRLHALDLTTGLEQFSGPKEVEATYPGTGDGSTNGTVTFNPTQYNSRPALLILNGVVYTAWGSHCDGGPYGGWVIGYNETTLAQTGVLDLTPNGAEGGIWMAGAGPAADASGNIYLLTGNGTFDTTLTNGFPSSQDYGNAFVKISTTGGTLSVVDYFTMDSTVSESSSDTDFGSGGMMLLPSLTGKSGSVSLAVGAGKDHNVYVVNQANMGKFSSSADNIYQQMSGVMPSGVWSSPAWFNGFLYYGGVGDYIKAFGFASGLFDTVASSHSPTQFGYPGATPSISANGTSNGIVWAAENTSPAVLHAYNAAKLATELYNSNQAANGRDQFGSGNKYIVPTIANGKVYVGTTTGVGVLGLLATPGDVSATPRFGVGREPELRIAIFRDTAGAGSLEYVYAWFNSSLTSPANSCFLYYQTATNQLSLLNDAATAWLVATPGTAATIQNSQCSVNVATSTIMRQSGNTLTLTLAMTFKPAYAGAKNVYLYATDVSGSNSGWHQLGAWTVPVVAGVPATVSVTPNSGTGASQNFALEYSDTAGAASLQYAYAWFNASLTSAAGSCFVYYQSATNQLNLLNDAATAWLVATPGTAAAIQNSQCSLSMAATTVTRSGNTLTLTLATTFKPAYAGAKNVYQYATDVSGSNSGWQQLGAWIVPMAAGVPSVVSVTPNSGSGATQSFALQYSDTAGAASLQYVYAWFNASLTSAANSCFLVLSTRDQPAEPAQ